MGRFGGNSTDSLLSRPASTFATASRTPCSRACTTSIKKSTSLLEPLWWRYPADKRSFAVENPYFALIVATRHDGSTAGSLHLDDWTSVRQSAITLATCSFAICTLTVDGVF
ncbi:hypothetical protein K437DRAFT_266092 [Tilletiaria anomala UBC 951]|uniref:Uncharacterized protein n=1 Tax=Tilletiaria anomala (strain ATCC 24038 / CBS 436.72 / UBC 951) TaxID=1037660 RepID=A0A066WR91_TILAU|nr:uncharacterized protein K437DRAFT_266092 [Tilletiaria anomala UBC 951]KDN53165.1 hypothetical protein K437DRAFT_266092 [Tilletiaria anomala UBC 951]